MHYFYHSYIKCMLKICLIGKSNFLLNMIKIKLSKPFISVISKRSCENCLQKLCVCIEVKYFYFINLSFMKYPEMRGNDKCLNKFWYLRSVSLFNVKKNALFLNKYLIVNTYSCAQRLWKEVHLIDTSYWVAFKEIETSSELK